MIPISVGIAGVVKIVKARSSGDSVSEEGSGFGGAAFVTSVGTQIGNGADTILTFGALFADSNPQADFKVLGSLAAMATLFAVLGGFLIRRPALRVWIDRYANYVTPVILILVGGYILANTATDVMLD